MSVRSTRLLGTGLATICSVMQLGAAAAVLPTPAQAQTAPASREASRPNILIILADDLGYGETGFQGYVRDVPTPNLDSIAANGVRFTNGYVSCPYCSPARAGLLTGRYQERSGHEFNPAPANTVIYGDAPGLALSERTIGDRLKAAGYATGWFGKSHQGLTLAQNPTNRGFDEFYGFLQGAHSYLTLEDSAMPQGNDVNTILRGTTPASASDEGPDPYYTTDAFARETAEFIEENRERPWLAYLAFNAVHSPLEATEKYESRFAHIADPKRRHFAAMLSALDDGVGRVLATLRAHGLEENTLIFFLSDNGGPTAQITSGNGPLRGFKAQTWEGGIRVPFTVQWKDHLPAGRVEDEPVIQLDILPTALAAAGVPVQEEWKIDGVNLLPLLSGQQADLPDRPLFWRFGPQLAVRYGDWKLVKAVDRAELTRIEGPEPATLEGAQLYNLATDIGETTNLAAQEPAKVRELAALWQSWNATLVPPRWRPDRTAQSGGSGAR